jgi:hypothetical protein
LLLQLKRATAGVAAALCGRYTGTRNAGVVRAYGHGRPHHRRRRRGQRDRRRQLQLLRDLLLPLFKRRQAQAALRTLLPKVHVHAFKQRAQRGMHSRCYCHQFTTVAVVVIVDTLVHCRCDWRRIITTGIVIRTIAGGWFFDGKVVRRCLRSRRHVRGGVADWAAGGGDERWACGDRERRALRTGKFPRARTPLMGDGAIVRVDAVVGDVDLQGRSSFVQRQRRW